MYFILERVAKSPSLLRGNIKECHEKKIIPYLNFLAHCD